MINYKFHLQVILCSLEREVTKKTKRKCGLVEIVSKYQKFLEKLNFLKVISVTISFVYLVQVL